MKVMPDYQKSLIKYFADLELVEMKRPSYFMDWLYADYLAAAFQRHYTQAGPWADMIREG